MRTIALLLCLGMAAGARAQEAPREATPPAVAPPPGAAPAPAPMPAATPAHSAAFEFWTAPPDDNAVARGRGAMLLVLGSIAMPLGIALAGSSDILWEKYNSNCNFSCPSSNDSYLAGAVSLTTFGALFFAGGVTMLALGADQYVKHKRPLVPIFTANGVGYHF